jgi:hypothetical protein
VPARQPHDHVPLLASINVRSSPNAHLHPGMLPLAAVQLAAHPLSLRRATSEPHPSHQFRRQLEQPAKPLAGTSAMPPPPSFTWAAPLCLSRLAALGPTASFLAQGSLSHLSWPELSLGRSIDRHGWARAAVSFHQFLSTPPTAQCHRRSWVTSPCAVNALNQCCWATQSTAGLGHWKIGPLSCQVFFHF